MQTEDVLIVLFCEVDDWLQQNPPPIRPGPRPACHDSEVLTVALARELLGCETERRFLRRVRADWRHLFPRLPAQSECNRRLRWLWGALELLRQHYLAQLPAATEDWYAFDTTPIPVKAASRVRGPDQWYVPGAGAARFGRCAARAWWFYGFRLAVLTPLIDPVPLRWALVPAALNERDALDDLVAGMSDLALLADKGLAGRVFTADLAEQGIGLLTPPTKRQRTSMPKAVQRFIAAHRNRIEGVFTTGKDQFHLERHRALTPWGLLTRVVLKLAAFTLRLVWRRAGREIP
jgi:hypothetical protein